MNMDAIDALLSRAAAEPKTPEAAEWARGVREAADVAARMTPGAYRTALERMSASDTWYAQGVETVISALWESGAWR